ncbi:sulfatase-like hydrolase/transferase [Halioglobus pacificus]|uniref:Arylsulfatase n=1 Tax=Parahalioglobus pacificus TaxID=930806 RepID=A0A918XM83_9GAMM|nr:sulfatase-like hydrolase/transferase [Halioglobus pacificus]GHD38315.1 arylsulfatase [Halioglobus pacificus]
MTFSPMLRPLLIAGALLVSGQSAAAEKPNIVLILMDNFGYGEVGVYGGGVLRGAPTPNIDSIASDGVQLTNFNVEAECTPSRASLMTGRYGMRTRLRQELPPRDIWYGITAWEITLAEMLSDRGYATGMFGKWHLGAEPGRYPTDQGFDEWYGIPNSSDQAFWPDSDSFQADAGVRFTHVMSAIRGKVPVEGVVYDREKRTLIDGEITDKAIDYIQRQAKADKPFFAFLPYTQTHEPVDAHPDFKGSTGNGAFADVLAQTDSYVGRILSTLDELGIADDTIVIFTADNGREGIKRSFGFTGPWRGSMFSPYEGSLRVPFLLRYPGTVPAGQVSNELMHLVDLFPTLANWSGGDIPTDRTMDGTDQTDFLSGKQTESNRETVMIYIGNELFGAKWRHWKVLIKEIDDKSYAIQNMAYPSYYNLLIDPKEEEPEKFYLDDTWVDSPLWEAMYEHEQSLAKDAGTPGD